MGLEGLDLSILLGHSLSDLLLVPRFRLPQHILREILGIDKLLLVLTLANESVVDHLSEPIDSLEDVFLESLERVILSEELVQGLAVVTIQLVFTDHLQ